MKALSLWQPWASAIPFGLKRIETRHWSTRYRGPLAIHAAKRWTRDEREMAEIEQEAGRLPKPLPLGAIVAVAKLVDIRSTSQIIAGGLSGDERYWGNYGLGRFGWILEDIEKLDEPVPWKGAQGLFNIPEDFDTIAPLGRLL